MAAAGVTNYREVYALLEIVQPLKIKLLAYLSANYDRP
jgi:hypothetical protein